MTQNYNVLAEFDYTPSPVDRGEGRAVERGGGGNRVAVFAFAGHVFTQSPLTTDHTVLVEMIDSLAYESISHSESGGTAIGDALLVAADTLVSTRLAGRDQVILLITDGEANIGIEPGLAARYLREHEVRLHVIGIGGDDPVEVYVYGEPFINQDDEVLVTSLDDTQLIALAETANGSYYRAQNQDGLVDALATDPHTLLHGRHAIGPRIQGLQRFHGLLHAQPVGVGLHHGH